MIFGPSKFEFFYEKFGATERRLLVLTHARLVVDADVLSDLFDQCWSHGCKLCSAEKDCLMETEGVDLSAQHFGPMLLLYLTHQLTRRSVVIIQRGLSNRYTQRETPLYISGGDTYNH